MFDFTKALSSLTTLPREYPRRVAFDFETTGIWLHHHDAPFMMAATFDDGESHLWEGVVDPMTRQVVWSDEDRQTLAEFFSHRDWLYIASNSKFDTRCADRVINGYPSGPVVLPTSTAFDPIEFLCRCHDTIMQHHALNNAESHALKDAALKYASIPDKDESDLHAAVKEARLLAKRLGWKIASKEACPQQRRAPAKKGWAVMDMWLPKAMAEHLNYPKKHPWWTLCGTYCTYDTLRSVILHDVFEDALLTQRLNAPYLANRTSLPISFAAEERGVSINVTTAKTLIKKFETDRANALRTMTAALGLHAPINPASTDVVRQLLYGYFQVPVTRYTKPKKATSTPKPSTDSDTLTDILKKTQEMMQMMTGAETVEAAISAYAPPLWQEGVEPKRDFDRRLKDWRTLIIEGGTPSVPQLFSFVSSLLMFKKANTSIKYLDGYILGGKVVTPTWYAPTAKGGDGEQTTIDESVYAILHPSYNSIGTKTTRYSSSNPNGQNISKGGKGKKGLEWLFKTNHSLRSVFGPIPGREWWSFDYHQIQLVIFAILSGDEKMVAAAHDGKDFHTFMAKEIFGSSFDPDPKSATHKYQRDIAKTVNFAFVFGAQEDKLNRTAGMAGLYDILCNVFPQAVAFLERTEHEVRRTGYITTPGGYRLYVPEGQEYAGVNYKVQGSEGEIVKRAQYGVTAYLNAKLHSPEDMYPTLWVHDDLIFDARLGFGQSMVGPIIRIMNDAAASFGMPVHTGCKHILTNWSEGKEISV